VGEVFEAQGPDKRWATKCSATDELPSHKLDGKDIGPLLLRQAGAKVCATPTTYTGTSVASGSQWAVEALLPTQLPHAGWQRPGQRRQAGPVQDREDRSGAVQSWLGFETTNVAERNPEVVRRLQGLADAMRADWAIRW